MKQYFIISALLAFTVTAVPAIPVCFSDRSFAAGNEDILKIEEVNIPESPEFSSEPYKVLDVSTGKVLEVPVKDYVTGAVFAEMPADFSDEAIKAQAVAAHTYAERQRMKERSSPTRELCGADFSNDTSKYQGYFTEAQAKQYFGDDFEKYYGKISTDVDEVIDFIITYNDEPIIAAFHSMSPGKTESAENAWGNAAPYLLPVDSIYDTDAPDYMEEVRFTDELLRTRLTSSFGDISLGDDFTEWIEILKVSDSGTVLSANAGDKQVSGNDIRSALGLRSACFEIRYEGSEAVITTKGFGHGVGMSQYGAEHMAEEGKGWRDILNYYYTGCKIESCSS